MHRILNNWSLKLTSLVLAIALWSHVRGEVNPIETATFTLRPEVETPADLTVANPEALPKEVRVVLRAPHAVLRELKGGAPTLPLTPADEPTPLPLDKGRAWLDFSLARPGRQDIPVKVMVSVSEAEVLGVKPPNVPLLLTRAKPNS
jgi:hypothetical protein